MSSNSSIEKALALRQKNRTTNSAKKRAEADRLKNEGNDMFKDTNYVGASRRYIQATKLVGHTPVLMSNLAAAHLKLEQYEIAEWAATVALLYDPHMTKARYRRGVARGKQAEFEAAHADFETVLIGDPHCTEANNKIDKIQDLWNDIEECLEDGVFEGETPGPLLGTALEEAVKPDFDDDPWEMSSVDSDSSDCQHPGWELSFLTCPDDKSVRDRLGRNVCIRHLFDSCRFGNTCNYSHSKAYLKAGQWDNPGDEDQFMEYGAMIRQVAEIKTFTQKLHQIPPTSPIPEIKTWKWPGKRTPVITESPRRVVSAANKNRFVLLLSFEHKDSFAYMHTNLIRTLNSKIRVQHAFSLTDALTMLDSPDLAGVFVADPGAARRRNKKVSTKLIEYANAGEAVVIGGLFGTFVAAGEFDSFFRAWGLPWTQGSYHRTTFSLNRSHEMAGRNPSLLPEYSMKAVHVANIRQGDAVYTPTDGSRLESSVFSPLPITNLSESPAVHTHIGNGYLGYIGDVNAEDDNIILAMLGLLDAPHTQEPTTTVAPQPKKTTITPTPFVLILSFDSVKYVKTHYRDFISRIKQEIEVIHGLSNSRVMELISSPDLIGILIMDSPIADAENAPVLEKVVEFAKRGGKVVLGGLFPGGMAPDEMKAFFATSWDLPWEMSDYTSAEMIVNADHPVVGQYKPKSLDPTYHAKSVFLSGIKPNMVVYKAMAESCARSSRSNVKAAIVHTQVGKGHLGFIGDVNPGPEVTEVMLAMLGLNDLVHVH
ncbi:hypothetical protein BD779DRAFT_1669296 [Infundibulicybe gibba]|nr:hypothetical protein BD779DRAFT_1669296 [Infundibulicybe gibba]